MPHLLRLAQLVEIAKTLFRVRIRGAQANLFAVQSHDAAGGQNVYGKVNRDGAGMKQIQRPEIERAAGEVGSAWSLRENTACPVAPALPCRSPLLHHLHPYFDVTNRTQQFGIRAHTSPR